jgi:trk system potassium uptake protein TrkH
MTIISSGGFLPTNNLSNILINNTQIIVFSLLMLTSFFSIFLSYNLIYLRNRNLNFFNEDLHLLFYFLSVLIIFLIFFNFDNNFSQLFLSLTSSVSNIGISLENSPKNLSFVFLILLIIGGSFFSTSSGIRFLKLYLLIKFSINELLSHVRPNNVYINRFYLLNTNMHKQDIYKYFLSVVIFIISLFIISSLLAIFNFNFSEAFIIGILTLMNTVNSSMYGLQDFNFSDLNILSKYILIIFMIIGRVELITLLIISKKFLFKN